MTELPHVYGPPEDPEESLVPDETLHHIIDGSDGNYQPFEPWVYVNIARELLMHRAKAAVALTPEPDDSPMPF